MPTRVLTVLSGVGVVCAVLRGRLLVVVAALVALRVLLGLIETGKKKFQDFGMYIV